MIKALAFIIYGITMYLSGHNDGYKRCIKEFINEKTGKGIFE